jgi:hypothetical protein
LTAGWSAISAATSPRAEAAASFSSAAFRLATYAAWCFPWCSCMISGAMTGASAP